MSTQELIFRLGDLMITIGPSGFPSSAARLGDRVDYLRPQTEPGALVVGGVRDRWEPAGLVTDVDESEARYAAIGHPQLEYTIRNSFAGSWLQRHMLMNTSSAPVRVDRLAVPLPTGPGCVGWALTAGGETAWTIQPADGTGPVLAGELTQGTLEGWDAEGFRTGELVLPAGRRFVLQWRIESVSAAAQFTRTRRPTLSPRTELSVNEAYEVADPDTAVVVADPVTVLSEDDVQLVCTDRPGRYPVELRSSRGTNRIDLTWVPPFADLITDLSTGWLSARRSTAGVSVLPGGGAALGLQQAVITGLTEDREDAEDALALYAARLLERDRLSIMDQAFLAQETVRTGDPQPLERARSELLGTETLQPGLALAATRLCLAELALGGTPAAIVARLRQLAENDHAGRQQPVRSGDDHLLDEAARLETITVTGPAGSATSGAVVPHALAVGAELGSGLPGHRLGGIRPGVAVYAAAVLDLLPEAYGPELDRHWGTGPHAVADRTRTTALASALWPEGGSGAPDAGELGEAVGWLVLGRPME
jgi:hypothetical protein